MNAATFRTVELDAGAIRYTDGGTGPTLLFIHGVFANGELWNPVVPLLSPHFRCIVQTLPLGGHATAMRPEADLTPRGLAALIVELIAKLDLHDVTLVGNDTGGALCQLVIARHPERIAALVLTNCDAFEYFPPRVLRPLYAASRLAGFFWLLAAALRLRVLQRLFFATVAYAEPDPAVLDSLLRPFIANAAVRRDLRKTLAAVSARDTMAAAETFASFARPVLVLWGTDDFFFPTSLAQRLAQSFPDGRVELVPGARTFVPQDKPAALATSLERFFAAPAIA